MRSDKIIYSLTIADIQNVANQKLERNLSPDEIQKVVEVIAEKINWYDAIEDSITEKIKLLSIEL